LDEGVDELKNVLHEEGKDLYFQVFHLYYIEPSGETVEGEAPRDLTHREVAERLGVKPSDVMNYLSAAKKRLREILRGRVRDYVSSEEDERTELDFVLGSDEGEVQ
jgi:hypothetical protein